MADGPIDTETGLPSEEVHEVVVQTVEPGAEVAELNEVCEERDALRVRVEALEMELREVGAELDKQGAPGAALSHARIRLLAHAQMRKLEEVEERAKDDVAKARASTFRKLSPERDSKTCHIAIGPDHDLYVTAGLYDDGSPGEIFLKMSKQGSTESGFADAFAIAISLCLKHGVPLDKIVRKFSHMRFEPSGFTGKEGMPHVESPVDAVMKWLALKFPKNEKDETK